MDALTALHTRTSVNLLSEPGPNSQQLEHIVQAGLRACDHRSLKPWHYVLIEGEARKRFGELMVKVKTTMDGVVPDQQLATKLRSKPLRAPTILVVVARIQEHEKVPEVEQILSAGASAQMMMTAAHAQGYGAIWRSGSLMFEPAMRDGLGLNPDDQIVGFLYIGTTLACKPVPIANSDDFVSVWTGE